MSERITYEKQGTKLVGERILSIIEELGFYDDGVSVREIALIVGKGKSTIQRHINRLRQDGRLPSCHGAHRANRIAA